VNLYACCRALPAHHLGGTLVLNRLPSDDWFEHASIADLQYAMEQYQLTARDLVLYYLQRIAQFDRQGPILNSVLEVNPDAIHWAEALDAERKVSGPRGPLHGIPILIKDNIDTADKMHTSAGSLALANSYASKDSFVAAQLRKAGAIILGKTNLTEWANFMAENMPNGYSSRGGQVLSAYGPGIFDVGGSSAGSGVAISAGFAAAAIGTETSGSILSPASQNSLVGIKPTVGLIGRTGIIPIAHSQDTAGPMTKSVMDAALLLTALAGVDREDYATQTNLDQTTANSAVDYSEFLDATALRGRRIGIARKYYYDDLEEDQLAIMNQAIADMAAAGAEIVDNLDIASTVKLNTHTVLVHEFKSDLNAYLARLSPQVPVHSLRDVIGFNLAHASTALKYGQAVLLESEATSGSLADHEYLSARLNDLKMSQDEGLDAIMAEHQLDAIVFPANYGAGIAAKAGYPSITVPGGYLGTGQPFGVTFTAKAFEEAKLISFAFAYEQATKHRLVPKLG